MQPTSSFGSFGSVAQLQNVMDKGTFQVNNIKSGTFSVGGNTYKLQQGDKEVYVALRQFRNDNYWQSTVNFLNSIKEFFTQRLLEGSFKSRDQRVGEIIEKHFEKQKIFQNTSQYEILSDEKEFYDAANSKKVTPESIYDYGKSIFRSECLPILDCGGDTDKFNKIKQDIKADTSNMVILQNSQDRREAVVVKLGKLLIEYSISPRNYHLNVNIFQKNNEQPTRIADFGDAGCKFGRFSTCVPFWFQAHASYTSGAIYREPRDYEGPEGEKLKAKGEEFKEALVKLVLNDPKVGADYYTNIFKEMCIAANEAHTVREAKNKAQQQDVANATLGNK